MLFPWANSIGALVGALAGAAFVGWITIGALVAISKQQIKYPTKPLSVSGCDHEVMSNYYNYLNQSSVIIPTNP